MKASAPHPIWHPFTPDPFLGPRASFVRASGAYLWDDQGRKYYDGTSSWWCQIHGHCHPRLAGAVARQAATLDQVLLAPHSHPVAVEFAAELTSAMGDPFTRVFYSDDGSTAVEAALKMALQYWSNHGQTQRRKFLSFERAYHGDTLGAVAVGGVSLYHSLFQGSSSGVVRAPAPYCYRCPFQKKYPGCAFECAAAVEHLLEQNAGELAAIIVEPLLMGAGGFLVYPSEVLERVVKKAQSLGVLVIFDEVFTAFGRTGTLFAYEQILSRPDIVCLSKGLTSGMLALGATVVGEKIYAGFSGGGERTFFHGHTFTGNGLATAVALESLRLFKDEGVIARNLALTRCMALQTPRFLALPRVGDVRHLGMVWALELVTDKATQRVPQPANGLGWAIAQRLWDQGVFVRPMENFLYLVPPYCTTEGELQGVFSLLYSAVGEVPCP